MSQNLTKSFSPGVPILTSILIKSLNFKNDWRFQLGSCGVNENGKLKCFESVRDFYMLFSTGADIKSSGVSK